MDEKRHNVGYRGAELLALLRVRVSGGGYRWRGINHASTVAGVLAEVIIFVRPPTDAEQRTVIGCLKPFGTTHFVDDLVWDERIRNEARHG